MVHLNLWDRETENWNVLVVGSSGTGKSFTINQLLIKNLPMNPYVMIIDKSQSYKTLCRLAGGRYLNYDLESKHHLNIFDYPLDQIKELDGEIDPDHIASIIMYLGVVLANIKENRIEETEELDKALIQEAVKQTYRNVIGEKRVPLLSDLKETLLKKAEDKKVPGEFQYICRKQAEVLKLYTGTGMYANLTDRESTVKADNSFIVFDTSGISDNDKKAVGLAVFTISNYCLSKAKENKELNRLSQLAMDEAWYLAQYPAGLAFLLRIAKTARHLRLQPIFATQEIGEFFGVKGVEAILKNTSTKILLKLVGDDIDHAKGLLQLNPNQVEKVSNLHMVKGIYSQAMIHQTLRQGIVNIYPDELAYHIATTYGPEAAIRDRYLETYAPEEDPVSTLAAIAKWIEDKENNSVLKPLSKEKEVISRKVDEVAMK
jgi:type IV secretory pathway VirB4 component